MMWKDVCYLLKEKNTLDELNRPKIQYEEIKAYCNVKSVGQSEFYQAQVAGLKPEMKIELKLIDLNGITHIKLNSKLYKILRTFKKEDVIEIVLVSTLIENK